MAQSSDDDQAEIASLKRERQRSEARKAALDAQKASLEAEKAVLDAQMAVADAKMKLEQSAKPPDPTLTDLGNQKAVADAHKALADSQSALSQALVAKLLGGEVKAGPYGGSVDLKDKAGTEEALLLAASAVRESARRIAEAIHDRAHSFHLFGAKEFPNFQRLMSFRFRKELIKQAFAAAGVTPPAAALRDEAVALTPALVAAGLDAFGKILGFFKTDYTAGAIDVKLDESLLLFAVAGRLNCKNKAAYLPLYYQPNAQTSSIEAVTKELAQLVDLRARADQEAKALGAEIAKIEAAAADPLNAATKAGFLATAAALKPRVERLTGVIALYDDFASALTTVDAAGAVPLTTLLQEFAIDAALQGGGAVLLLRLENTGGGYLIKKNLLTGLGVMPLHHMGGATVSYVLLGGKEGKVLAGDVLPIYGGYIRSDHLARHLAAQ